MRNSMTGLTMAEIGPRVISETKREELYEGQDFGRLGSMTTLPHCLSELLRTYVKVSVSM